MWQSATHSSQGLPATITIAVALQVSSPLLAGKLDTLSESKDSHAAKYCTSPNISHRSCRRGSIDLARAIENRFAVLNLSGSTDFARRVSRSSWES